VISAALGAETEIEMTAVGQDEMAGPPHPAKASARDATSNVLSFTEKLYRRGKAEQSIATTSFNDVLQRRLARRSASMVRKTRSPFCFRIHFRNGCRVSADFSASIDEYCCSSSLFEKIA
jgi:hypothetical protein